MKGDLTGGCRCGTVRYAVAAETLPRVYACHCLDCQTWTGSAFSQQAILPDEQLAVTGPVSLFELTTPSGRLSRHYVCGTCHTRIFNGNESRPGQVVLRAGTLDRSDRLIAAAHIWVKRKQAWVVIADGIPCWPEAAPAEALAAVLAER